VIIIPKFYVEVGMYVDADTKKEAIDIVSELIKVMNTLIWISVEECA
jgi:hypothetical protein